jgi:hypothetical protein
VEEVEVHLYQIGVSTILGTPGPVLSEVSATIADDDPTLHVDGATDPGADQVFAIPGATVTQPQVIFTVQVSYIPQGETAPVTVTGAVVSLTVDGTLRYYLMAAEGAEFHGLDAGATVTVTNRVGYGNTIDYEDLRVPCFTPGTAIATPDGERPVEDIAPGDLVLTEDRGARKVRWAGRRDLTAADLMRRPELRPVRIAAGALGAGLPRRDLLLSPQHRVLVAGWPVELWLGEPEVLAPVVQLVGHPGIAVEPPGRGVSYLHLMFDRHEIVRAEGAPVESLYFGPGLREGLPAAQVAEILALFPALASDAPAPARPFARRYEALAALG